MLERSHDSGVLQILMMTLAFVHILVSVYARRQPNLAGGVILKRPCNIVEQHQLVPIRNIRIVGVLV
jgi:hypothetical protein